MKTGKLVEMDKQRRRLELLLRLECTPLLSDTRKISEIYAEVEGREWDARERGQVFLFVTLMFYAPSKLILGRSISNTLMRELKRVTGCSQSLLSHRSEGLLLRYQVYARFNELVRETARVTGETLVTGGMNRECVEEYIRKWENEYGEY